MEIRKRNVLVSALREVLADHPEGLRTKDAYDVLGDQYDFPADWRVELPAGNGYDHLAAMGISDWRSIPQSKLLEC